jgi:hypothetical protein
LFGAHSSDSNLRLGRTRNETRFTGETAWLSLNQITELFQRDKSVISKHIKNVFEEGELQQLPPMAKPTR